MSGLEKLVNMNAGPVDEQLAHFSGYRFVVG